MIRDRNNSRAGNITNRGHEINIFIIDKLTESRSVTQDRGRELLPAPCVQTSQTQSIKNLYRTVSAPQPRFTPPVQSKVGNEIDFLF